MKERIPRDMADLISTFSNSLNLIYEVSRFSAIFLHLKRNAIVLIRNMSKLHRLGLQTLRKNHEFFWETLSSATSTLTYALND